MGLYGDTPDYDEVADASEYSAELAYDLGQQQIDFSRQVYDETKPLLDQITQAQIGVMNSTQAQGEDYYNYLVGTYRPLEQQMVADAQKFNTEAYREQLAQQAAADAGLAFSTTQQANERAMMSMGVNPNSGKFQTTQRQSELALAAARSGAMNATRQQADALGYARMMDAAGLGRNLTGASTGAYGVALNAGNSAASNSQLGAAQMNTGLANGANTMMTGAGQQVQGMSSMVNAQTQAYGMQLDMMGSLLGTAAGFVPVPSTTPTSDRRLKERVVVAGSIPRLGLVLYEFSYIFEPTKRWLGVMADEVAKLYPDAVVTTPAGYLAVDYERLGIQMVEAPA